MRYRSHPLEPEEASSSRHDYPERILAPVPLHPAEQCDACYDYAIHLESTGTTGTTGTTIPQAHAGDGTFMEGIELGRRLQRETDNTIFMRYRTQVEKAEAERDESRRYRFRAEALEQELALVKDALLAAQMAYEDLAEAQSQLAVDSSVKKPLDVDQSSYQVPHDNLGELWEEDFRDEPEPLGLNGGQPALFLDDLDEDAFLLEQLQALDQQELEQFWTDYRHEHQIIDDGPTSSALTVTSKGADHHLEISIAQIADLMEDANADADSDAAQVVQLLYHDADQTPREDRTPAQVYLMLTWVPPQIESAIDALIASAKKGKGKAEPVAAPRLLLTQQPFSHTTRKNEVFVDACPYGVGLIFGDHWLAWTFTRGHPKIPIDSARNVNMSWGELVAAELGIRALIAAGLRDCAVVLRSDNGGVVQALKTGRWTPKFGLDVGLARVLALCAEARLRVAPVYVWTKINPADKPSRGVYPPAEMMLPNPPDIPAALVGMVTLVTPRK